MQKNFYIEDFSNEYKLLDELDISSGYINDEPEIEIVSNIKVEIYSSPNKFTYEEAEKMVIDKYFGDMSVQSQNYGYSEYTIEGFNLYSLKIGNHDLIEILNNIDGYKILKIERVKQNEPNRKDV